VGDLKIPPQLQFQITKHLNLAFFDLKLKFFVGDLDLGLLGGGLPMHGGP
jgi:hypothetical protein